MSNVVTFPRSKRPEQATCSSLAPKLPGPTDTLDLAWQLKTLAQELFKAVDDLERDGCQIGCDAIGLTLEELHPVARAWLTYSSRNPYNGGAA